MTASKRPGPGRKKQRPGRRPGRRVVARITWERKHGDGESLGRIADGLNADRITTKGGGAWYPATVKSVLETAGKWAGVVGNTAA